MKLKKFSVFVGLVVIADLFLVKLRLKYQLVSIIMRKKSNEGTLHHELKLDEDYFGPYPFKTFSCQNYKDLRRILHYRRTITL